MRFEILEIPGQGAHATVCVARRLEQDQVVCLKVLHTAFGSDSEPAMRVRDEARLLDRLKHPNIVGLYERLEIDGRQVLVMEWVKGIELQRLVRKVGRFPASVALTIASRIAEAAEYAYNVPEPDGELLRLVHRDLNLTNVLLSVTGEVKVLDFGMARATFEDRESDTMVTLRGTAGYTAPEGLSTVAPKLDVYSLGICLLYMLTGHLPVFSKQKLSHDLRLAEVCDFLQEGAQDIPDFPAVRDLLRAMCAYLPEERIEMGEVIARLRAVNPVDADLNAFAEHARQIHGERSTLPAAEHPAYVELAFLEASSDGASGGDLRLRKLLREPRWFDREAEVKWMLVLNPDWTADPFVEYLQAANRQWWQVWIAPPPREGILAALRLLEGRTTAGTKGVCRVLQRHRDVEIAALAKRLLV